MFSGCTVLLDCKETALGSRNQQASTSAGKKNRVVLVPCPCSYFWWCGYFPRIPFATTDEFSVRVTKITSVILSHEITAYLSVFDLFYNSMNYGHIVKRM